MAGVILSEAPRRMVRGEAKNLHFPPVPKKLQTLRGIYPERSERAQGDKPWRAELKLCASPPPSGSSLVTRHCSVFVGPGALPVILIPL